MLLSPTALSYFPMLILHLLIVGYLLYWQRKTRTTWLLILWQTCLFLMMGALFLAGAIYSPLSGYLEWLGGSIFAMPAAVFMAQFAYHFPRQLYPREARLVLLISLLMLGMLLTGIIIELTFFPGIVIYNFDNNQFGFYVPHPFSSALLFDIFHSSMFVWTTLLWLRKTMVLSRPAAGANDPAPTVRRHLLVHPQEQEARAARNFTLLFIAAALTVFISTLEVQELLPVGSFSMAYMLVWSGAILVYVNNTSEYISFLAKLVGITLVTVLAIIGFSYPILLDKSEVWFDEARRAELRLLKPRLTGELLADLPEPIHYVAARPVADGLFSANYRLLFSRQPDPTAPFLAEQDQRLRQLWAEYPDAAPLIIRENPWLDPSQLGTNAGQPLAAFPEGTKMYRGVLNSAEGQFIRYGLIQGDTLYEVGYRYADYRLALHQQIVPLIYLTIFSVLAVLLIFPTFFRRILIQPLNNLFTGVKQVNAGNLQVTVSPHNPDEIGFLTQSFNAMIQSLYTLNQNLQQKIGEQTRTERELRINEERFRRVVTSISDHVYMTEIDSDGKLLNQFISPNIVDLTGYPLENFAVAWEFWPTVVIHPEDQARARAHAARLIAGQAGEIEYRLVRADDQVIWVRDSGRIEQSADRQVIYGVVSDITERKQAELEQQRLLMAARHALSRLAEAEELARQQLARELHDRVGQNLMALSLNLTAMNALYPPTSPAGDAAPPASSELAARLKDSSALVMDTTQLIRNVMDDLRSPVLETYGLLAALRWYSKQLAARASLRITVQGADPSPRPAAAIENTLFRIAQEALTNIIKHAQANQITITLMMDGRLLRLVIIDDGIGFSLPNEAEVGSQRQGMGLLTIQERAEAVGGQCLINSIPNVGTQVIAEVRI